jgi:peptidoglycan LD-endopeptidase CwlK
MGFVFGARSLSRLANAHPDLVRVFKRAISISEIDFTVLEVLRSLDRQKHLVAQGASTTMKSRHLPHPKDGKSRAVDVAPLVNGEVQWAWPLYHKLAKTIKQAAADEKVLIEWGGDWRRFKDGPHWQLPWKTHP